MNMPLALLNRRRRGAFNPAYLFALAEPGVWYDPSDLTTLFQDSAGTTPVTAAGQPVGLMLDKSKGLALGAELVSNGDFSNGVTGWSPQFGSSISVIGGELQMTAGAAGTQRFSQPITCVIGKTYRVTVTARQGTTPTTILIAASASANLSSAVATSAAITSTANTTVSFYFVATATTMYVGGNDTAATIGVTSFFDNISVREIAGNHATQATSAQRPTYQIDGTGRPYLSFDGVDDGMATSAIDFSATDAVTVFTGLRKLSDAARAMVVELGSPSATGSFQLSAPASAASNYAYASTGNVASIFATSPSSYPFPDTAVLTGQSKISTDTVTLRRNGIEVGASSADQGTVNYSNAILYIGRRGGTSLPFNGNIYSLIIRGAQSTTGQITATETWVNGKTGAF